MTRHSISYDYIISGSGSQIYDKNGECLYHIGMKRDMVIQVVHRLAKRGVQFVSVCGPEGRKGMRIPSFQEKDLDFLSEVNSMATRFETAAEAENFANSLNSEGFVSAFANGYSVDIAPENTSKASGIEKLQKHLNLLHDNIYTIGDSLNDLPMLKAYKGACVRVSHPQVLRDIPLMFESVSDYIQYLIERA